MAHLQGNKQSLGNNTIPDYQVFFRAWLSNPRHTGANAPSSRRLARKMAALASLTKKTKIIELGPGTGVITQALLEAGAREENMTLIELNKEFQGMLHQRYPKASIVPEDAFSVLSDLAHHKKQGENYTIISGLPLLLFSRKKRVQIRKDVLKLMGSTGKMVQFTYGLKSPVPLDTEMHAICSQRIWLNFPPAVVWTYTNNQRNLTRSLRQA